jgi:hypothetical protein
MCPWYRCRLPKHDAGARVDAQVHLAVALLCRGTHGLALAADIAGDHAR